MIAEMKVSPAWVPSPIVLQWGRDQMIAEMPPTEPLAARCVYASMGPRSNDRGNEFRSRPFSPNAAMLQWGRDQMIAEMPEKPKGPAPENLASMGPRSNDRGNGTVVCSSSDFWASFNGAAIK